MTQTRPNYRAIRSAERAHARAFDNFQLFLSYLIEDFKGAGSDEQVAMAAHFHRKAVA